MIVYWSPPMNTAWPAGISIVSDPPLLVEAEAAEPDVGAEPTVEPDAELDAEPDGAPDAAPVVLRCDLRAPFAIKLGPDEVERLGGRLTGSRGRQKPV